MMNNYNNLPQIESVTLPTGRTYKTPDGEFPSITTILGKTSNNLWLDAWKERVGEEEAARVSKVSTDRGTLVHSYLERYWNGENITSDLVKEPLSTVKMVQSLIDTTSKKITKVYAQEIAVWSPTLKCAGRVDKFCEWLNVPSCLDYKTAKKIKTDTKDYKLQITFYILAHNEIMTACQMINKGIIMIAVDGKDQPQIIEFDHRPFIPELKYRINAYYKNFSS